MISIGATLIAAAAYFAAINLATMLAFAWDKYCALKGLWRVPERTLLTMAAIGGTIGAVIATRHLRHKTQKEPFKTHLRVIAVLQLIVLLALLVPQICDVIWQFLQNSLHHGA